VREIVGYHEMDFTDGFPVAGRTMVVASDATKGLITNNFGSFLNVTIKNELIGTMNFIIRENTVVEDKPPGSPSTTVVNPLIQDTRDSITNNVIKHEFTWGVLTCQSSRGGSLNHPVRWGGSTMTVAGREGTEGSGGLVGVLWRWTGFIVILSFAKGLHGENIW